MRYHRPRHSQLANTRRTCFEYRVGRRITNFPRPNEDHISNCNAQSKVGLLSEEDGGIKLPSKAAARCFRVSRAEIDIGT